MHLELECSVSIWIIHPDYQLKAANKNLYSKKYMLHYHLMINNNMYYYDKLIWDTCTTYPKGKTIYIKTNSNYA